MEEKDGRGRVLKKYRHIKEGGGDNHNLRGHQQSRLNSCASTSHTGHFLLLFFVIESASRGLSRQFQSRDLPLLPLAADADEDNQDGDHEGGCRRDGSQQQQVVVGLVVVICPLSRIHHTALPSARLFTFTGAKGGLHAVSAQEGLRSGEERGGIKQSREMT